MKLSIPDILERVNGCKTESELELTLWQNKSVALTNILVYGLCDKFEFDVLVPEFRMNDVPEGYGEMSLYTECRKMYIFVKNTKIPIQKKKEILLFMLESLYMKESKLLVDIIEGRFRTKYPNIQIYNVKRVFPDIAHYFAGQPDREVVSNVDKVEETKYPHLIISPEPEDEPIIKEKVIEEIKPKPKNLPKRAKERLARKKAKERLAKKQSKELKNESIEAPLELDLEKSEPAETQISL